MAADSITFAVYKLFQILAVITLVIILPETVTEFAVNTFEDADWLIILPVNNV